MDLWEQLAKAPTAPKGAVCSRLFEDATGKYHTYRSILDLVKDLCEKKFHCAMPPEVIKDIRYLPAFNYEGQCIEAEEQLSAVKCPFDEKPQYYKAYNHMAFCPYKIDLAKYPP